MNKHKDSPISVPSIAMMTALLLLITSITRLGTSLYLPALPLIGEDLKIEETLLGLTLTVYFGSFAFFTLFAGPISDAFGRRRVLLTGGLVFLLGSVACGLAQDGYSLIAGRVFQAVGASAIPVASRAVIRDAFNDRQVMTVLGWMGAMGGLVPAFAPILGGLITQYAGWRFTFAFLVLTCLVVVLITLKKLPETLPREKRMPLKLSESFKSFGIMMTTGSFILVLMPIILCFAIQGAYFACAPFVFIRDMGLTPTQFGLTNLVLVVSLITGRILCPFLIRFMSQENAYTVCGFISFFGGLGFFALFYIPNPNLWIVLIPAALFGLGFGTMMPIGLKGALTAFRHQSGTASALYGCLTLGASAVFSAFAGIAMDMEYGALNVLAAFGGGCCMLILVASIFSRSKIE